MASISKFADHSLEDHNAPTLSYEDGKVGDNPTFISSISGIINERSYIKSKLIPKDISDQFIKDIQQLKNKMK